jgi:hypothetical protein
VARKLIRLRGVLLLVASVVSALLAAKGSGIHTDGFWDGPI